VYRIRTWDTTLGLARFNNSSSQVTILVLQNTSDRTVTGHAHFWSAAGALAGTQAFTTGPHAAYVVNTSTLPGLSGVSGTVTVSHDGSYGVVVGKAVALESATGFTFDTALQPRRR
jgi:surface antigen